MKYWLPIYWLGFHLALLSVRVLAWFAAPHSKLRALVNARKKLTTRIAAFRSAVPGELVWFHVASAGELEQALPLMESVRQRYPQWVIYLSFFSPSGEKAAHAEAKRRHSQGTELPWDYCDYLCWDSPRSVRRYVELLQPKCFLSLHAEIWPVLFSELHRVKIPVCLGAMYLPSPQKYRLWKRKYLQLGLAGVSRIATVDVRTAHYLQTLLPGRNIQTLGDPRIDRVLSRASRNPLFHATRPASVPEVVLASLHDADWEALTPWLREQAADASSPSPRATRVWIVPHEPKESVVQALQTSLQGWGLKAERFTQLRAQSTEPFVIVDTVGQLAELYARASIAFVGGSFSKAVHNVLEPAAYGVAIVTGPQIENSCEACEMAAAGALVQTDSGERVRETLQALLLNELYRGELGQRARGYLKDRQGVGNRYGDWLSEFFGQP